jgi:exonuclease
LAEFHQFLQDKLGDAVIVGHNIVLDTRFLEAFGISLSGRTIDTLDLVQFILPTHHSYNLENLMHHFNVKHEEAHRALGDSLATIRLLEHLLRQYQAFPAELRGNIIEIAAKQDFFWAQLFEYPFHFPSPPARGEPPPPAFSGTPEPQTQLGPGNFILRPFQETTPRPVAALLQEGPDNYLLAVADKPQVLKLWREGIAHGVFSPEDCFDSEKFRQFLARDLSADQARFCLKVLVWLHTNWQTETIIDLNLSFAGGQFRPLVTGRPFQTELPDKVLCCDYQTFAAIAGYKLHTSRTPVLWTAHALEQWLSEGNQGRLTWNQILYFLKTIYNPETNFGREPLREPVINALAAADLFFGLVNLLLRQHYGSENKIPYELLSVNSHVFGKIRAAAKNFTAKIDAVCEQGNFPELERFTRALNDFFTPASGHIKWVETGETNCVFVNRPLHIAPVLKNLLAGFPSPLVMDNLPHEGVLRYILERLGLVPPPVFPSALFDRPIECIVVSGSPAQERVLPFLESEYLPAVLLFTHPSEARDFYDRNYSHLKSFAQVFAQGYSGGSNKILRNFGIRPASILIATGNFIIRNGRPLGAKTLIIQGLPQLDREHPYLQALNRYWQDKIPNFMELQEILRLYLLAQLVYSPSLERVYLFSPKAFGLMEQLPFFKLKSG